MKGKGNGEREIGFKSNETLIQRQTLIEISKKGFYAWMKYLSFERGLINLEVLMSDINERLRNIQDRLENMWRFL